MQRAAFLVSALAFVSCAKSATHQQGTGHDLAGFGSGRDLALAGGGSTDLAGMMSTDDAATSSMDDLYGIESGTAYGDLAINGDASGCVPGQTGLTCPNALPPNAGCGAVEICGNGIDDDCDGYVDSYPSGSASSCPCTPGNVQKCFLGPPGKRGIGQCSDGHQTCQGTEFGAWGPCTGAIGPSPEVCDKLDNDCDGCVDDGLCCGAVALNCPAPGDPRIAPVAPYTDLALKGELFYTGTATSWSWTVVGGPCDQLFAAQTPPTQSFTLTNANMRDATVHFTLSGDYTVTMTVVDATGTHTCTWIQHVQGPGVRVELCWDHTGPASAGGADLDLHVHKSGSTKAWSSGADDCYFSNCTASSYVIPIGVPNWYGQTALANCSGAKNGNLWMSTPGMDCYNPRLDNDNIAEPGIPENTNIDNPNNGDKFRVMVHYYGQDSGASSTDVTEHPIVNIYCGGNLLNTYGQAPNQLAGFNHGTGSASTGQMWRVADVQAQVTAGNVTGCTVTPLHPPATVSGYYVTNNNANY